MASILVCEDDPVFRALVRDTLRAHGHAVTCAENGLQADECLAAGAFDLLITDIVMPDRDGLELISATRQSRPGLPILVVTAGMSRFGRLVETAAAAIGANEILLKPVSMPQLLQRVDTLLER
jgi:CheY-like chemotaxis protein